MIQLINDPDTTALSFAPHHYSFSPVNHLLYTPILLAKLWFLEWFPQHHTLVNESRHDCSGGLGIWRCTYQNTIFMCSKRLYGKALSMSVWMLSARKNNLPLFPVPSLHGPQSKRNEANGGHDINCFVWSQGQAREIRIVSSNKVDKIKSHFPTWDAGKREREVIELGLWIANTMKDDTSAKSRIQEPWKALTHPYSLQSCQKSC